MLISNEYITYYTPSKQALQIIYILKKYINTQNAIIVDANAGIGGNAYFFCKYFKFVYCIDTNDVAINYLYHNLDTFHNKYIIQENCLTIFKIITFDIIFLDPPWGGKDYKQSNRISLYLQNINVITIINNLYSYSKLIALKAPINFDLKFKTKWKVHLHKIYRNDNFSTLFNLLVFYK